MQHIKTAILMAIVMIPILIWGQPYFIFDGFCLLLSIGAATEYRLMLRKKQVLPLWIDVLTIVSTGLFFATLLAITHYNLHPLYLFIVLMGLVLLYSILMVFVDTFRPQDFGMTLLMIVYCSVGFSAFAYLRHQGLLMVIYALAVVMMTDTAAYFFGVRFGKHKIAPKVSPKKSYEGSIAGLVFGTVVGFIIGYFGNLFGSDFPIYGYLLISAFLSTVGQIGDLVASKFKRAYEIKDYSNLFPGHGGILDRFDSSMFAATFLLFIMIIIQVL